MSVVRTDDLCLRIQEDSEPERNVRFVAEEVTFGRHPENDLVLIPPYVSRSHGAFVWEEGTWYVVDKGSKLGLTLRPPDGDEQVELGSEQRYPLRGGEELRIRRTTITVELKPSEGSDPEPSQLMHVARIAENAMTDTLALMEGLKQDSRTLSLLLDLAKDLNSVEGRDQVLERIATTIFEALPNATHFAIRLLEGDGTFSPVYGLERGSDLPNTSFPVSMSILEMVIENEKATLFRLSEGPLSDAESILFNQIVSAMAVPLAGSRGITGVMLVDNRASEEPFKPSHLDLLIAVSGSAALALERAQHAHEIQHMFDGFIDASVTAIESRDPTTSGHSRRVAGLTVALAQAASLSPAACFMGYDFSREQLREISYAALLHDFGKVAVRECVLTKSRRLHPEELERIEARFELIRALGWRELLREFSDQSPNRPSTDAFESTESRVAQLDLELDEALALVVEMNDNNVVQPEQAERLRAIGGMAFVDRSGERRPFLTLDEIESLLIPRGTLNRSERKEIEAHVVHSYRALVHIPWPRGLMKVPDIVLSHHEKLDGTGYPYGIEGDEVPPESRILIVTDIYDALTASDRPYRDALSVDQGLDMLKLEADRGRIDEDLVSLFIEARVWEANDED